MAKHLDFGKAGEEKAVEFLKKQGFNILAQNWRTGHLEIDIIAEKKNVLHFVEVKSRKESGLIHARESLSYKKQKNLERLVSLWFLKNPHSKQSAQLDFIAVSYSEKEGYNIEYYPNYSQS